MTVTVSLSTAPAGDVFYSTTVRVNVVDCLNSNITISGNLNFPTTSPYEVRFGNSASFVSLGLDETYTFTDPLVTEISDLLSPPLPG